MVRRDIDQAINSSMTDLILKVESYYYNDGTSSELLCLHGTVACQYREKRYNIPIEIWLQQNHPNVSPFVYVKPTAADMCISSRNEHVLPDVTIIIPYLKNWCHVRH